MKPICSIVIPTRDCLPYLRKALDSVRAQEVDALEVLVVDDGSTDGSGAFLAETAAQWPALNVLWGGGIGPARARNLAIEAASADLVAFLDADDVWHEGKLAAQIAFHLRDEDAALSFSDYLHVDEDGSNRGTCFEFWKPAFIDAATQDYQRIAEPAAALLGCNVVGTSTVLARTAALRAVGGFPVDIPSAEDWDLWLRMADRGPVAASAAVTTDYLARPGSESKKVAARIAAMKAIVARYAQRTEPAMRAAVRLAEARIAVAEAELAHTEGRPLAAFGAHLRAFVREPSPRRAREAAAALASTVRKPDR